ncbi:hypothetical protein [Solihabitans fulvus]|nr:hypothetical protein [Solihabitans fulvus]
MDSVASGQRVGVAVAGEQLTLTTTGYTMTFQRVGPVAPSADLPSSSR